MLIHLKQQEAKFLLVSLVLKLVKEKEKLLIQSKILQETETHAIVAKEEEEEHLRVEEEEEGYRLVVVEEGADLQKAEKEGFF